MSKNIYLRVAGKLFLSDYCRDIPNMLDELSDIACDCIDFAFPHGCEMKDKRAWEDAFLTELICKINDRLKDT
jgi:hypothetical protein